MNTKPDPALALAAGPGPALGAAHGCAAIRITQLYNKLPEEISLDEIERIHT